MRNPVDAVIEAFAPSWALNRQESRRIMAGIRSYDAATDSHRAGDWTSTDLAKDPLSEVLLSQKDLWERSRDMCRNNAYGVRAQTLNLNCVVGAGIVPLVDTGRRRSKRSSEEVKLVLKDLLEKSRELDWLGESTLLELEDLVASAEFESGEVFVRRIWLDAEDRKGARLPFKIQLIEPDFLDTSIDTVHVTNVTGRNKIRGGIEYNKKGRKVAYHFLKEHPGSDEAFANPKAKSDRVLAKDILHIYDTRRRPGVGRGVPRMTPVILEMRDHKEFREAVLLRQKIANSYAAFIRRGPNRTNPILDKTKKGTEVDVLEPASVQYLDDGEEITLTNPPGAPDLHKFDPIVLRTIAIGIGFTYEALSGDLTDVNFTSGRMGRVHQDQNVKRWQRRMMIGQFLSPLTVWILEGLDLMSMRPTSFSKVVVKWTPPAQPMVDPSKEVLPMRAAVRSGFFSPQRAIISGGHDPEEVLLEFKEWNAALDKDKIRLDSDPRWLSSNGVNAGIMGDEDDANSSTGGPGKKPKPKDD